MFRLPQLPVEKNTIYASKHKTSSLNECFKPKLQIQYRSKMATHKIDIKYYMASITRSLL